MADQGAETPVQPEQKKPSLVERLKGRLALFWRRVGPESVIKDKGETYRAVHEALGPGKAQDVYTFLEKPYKALAIASGIGTTVVDVSLGAIANVLYRRWTGDFVTFMTGLGAWPGNRAQNLMAAIAGGVAGYAVGEGLRTAGGAAVGVGVAELGIAHKAAQVQERITRPLQVRVAQTVGRITRGWDAPSPTPTT